MPPLSPTFSLAGGGDIFQAAAEATPPRGGQKRFTSLAEVTSGTSGLSGRVANRTEGGLQPRGGSTSSSLFSSAAPATREGKKIAADPPSRQQRWLYGGANAAPPSASKAIARTESPEFNTAQPFVLAEENEAAAAAMNFHPAAVARPQHRPQQSTTASGKQHPFAFSADEDGDSEGGMDQADDLLLKPPLTASAARRQQQRGGVQLLSQPFDGLEPAKAAAVNSVPANSVAANFVATSTAAANAAAGGDGRQQRPPRRASTHLTDAEVSAASLIHKLQGEVAKLQDRNRALTLMARQYSQAAERADAAENTAPDPSPAALQSASSEAVSTLKGQLEARNTEIARLRREKAAVTQDLHEWEVAARRAKQHLLARERELSALTDEMDALRRQAASALDSQALEAELSRVRAEAAEAVAGRDSAVAELRQYEREVKRFENDLRAAREEARTAREDARAARDEAKTAKEELRDLRRRVKAQDAELEGKRQALVAEDLRLRTLANEMDEEALRIKSLEAELGRMKSTLEGGGGGGEDGEDATKQRRRQPRPPSAEATSSSSDSNERLAAANKVIAMLQDQLAKAQAMVATSSESPPAAGAAAPVKRPKRTVGGGEAKTKAADLALLDALESERLHAAAKSSHRLTTRLRTRAAAAAADGGVSSSFEASPEGVAEAALSDASGASPAKKTRRGVAAGGKAAMNSDSERAKKRTVRGGSNRGTRTGTQ